MNQEKDYIDTAELSKMLGLSVNTLIWRRARGRSLPRGFRLPGGRRWLYRLEDVEKWIKSEAETPKKKVGRPRKRPPADALERQGGGK